MNLECYLRSKFHGILWVFVDSRLVFDGLGAVSIAKGAQRLIVVVVDGPDTSTHHRFGVATQRVLEMRFCEWNSQFSKP